MPIEYHCPHCQSQLRVADENAGKQARCPHCNHFHKIPGELAAPTEPPQPHPTDSQQFVIDSVTGNTFGPVTKPEMDQWFDEGRISANCKIRPTGQTSAQPAWAYYPSLGPPDYQPGEPTLDFNKPVPGSATDSDDDNPYKASMGTTARRHPELGGLLPVEADLGKIFRVSWEVFTNELGLLLGVAITTGVVSIISNIINDSMDGMHDDGLIMLAFLAIIVLNLIQTFLAIGQTRICLKLLRGQPTSYAELFSGSDKFIPVVGFYLLIIAPLVLGFLLLIIPGVLMLLYFWPAFTLIVDDKTSVLESFGVAGEIGGRNMMNSFVLAIASVGIGIAGLAACCVGVFFAAAFLSVLWAAAYLMMSGQLR